MWELQTPHNLDLLPTSPSVCTLEPHSAANFIYLLHPSPRRLPMPTTRVRLLPSPPSPDEDKGSVVLLEGDPGVGKSTLLEHFLSRMLPQTTPAYFTAGSPFNRKRSFGVWAVIIQQFLDTHSGRSRSVATKAEARADASDARQGQRQQRRTRSRSNSPTAPPKRGLSAMGGGGGGGGGSMTSTTLRETRTAACLDILPEVSPILGPM